VLLRLLNHSGQRSFSVFSADAICSGYADYLEKEQSSDSNATDVLSESSACEAHGPRVHGKSSGESSCSKHIAVELLKLDSAFVRGGEE